LSLVWGRKGLIGLLKKRSIFIAYVSGKIAIPLQRFTGAGEFSVEKKPACFVEVSVIDLTVDDYLNELNDLLYAHAAVWFSLQ